MYDPTGTTYSVYEGVRNYRNKDTKYIDGHFDPVVRILN